MLIKTMEVVVPNLDSLLARVDEAVGLEGEVRGELASLWARSPQAAIALGEAAIAGAVEERDSSYEADDPRGPLDPAEVRRIEAAEGIPWEDAAAVAQADKDLLAVEAEFAPQSSDAPWLDTFPLAPECLPRPWEHSDYERDRRRAAQADVDLPEERWADFAERGLDPVAELVGAQRDARLEELRLRRELALQRGRERRMDEAARAAGDLDEPKEPDAPMVRFGGAIDVNTGERLA